MSSEIISTHDLHKFYADNHVLKGVNFNVQKGEVVCLIGASGSGKSTLLRCLNFLELPNRGHVYFEQKPIEINQININQYRTQIGMVFQSFNLFPHKSVLENIIEAPRQVLKIDKETAIKNARELLQKVGLPEKENALPNILSGGQQQRIAIARALAMHPKVMLFDEPTSALDPETVDSVLTVMRDLADDGMTMIVVTHEMGFARAAADRICFLHDGIIIEENSAEKLLDNPQHPRTKEFLSAVKR